MEVQIFSKLTQVSLTFYYFTVYRASFNSTLEEVRAPSGDWKRCIGDNAILMALMFLGVSVIGFAGKGQDLWLKKR